MNLWVGQQMIIGVEAAASAWNSFLTRMTFPFQVNCGEGPKLAMRYIFLPLYKCLAKRNPHDGFWYNQVLSPMLTINQRGYVHGSNSDVKVPRQQDCWRKRGILGCTIWTTTYIKCPNPWSVPTLLMIFLPRLPRGRMPSEHFNRQIRSIDHHECHCQNTVIILAHQGHPLD